jgi:hypothetical protein
MTLFRTLGYSLETLGRCWTSRTVVCLHFPTNGPAPNPTAVQGRTWPLSKAQLNVIPVPHGEVLEDLTQQTDFNNGLFNRQRDPLMSFLRNKIDHVIYIIKENKTYDQVLGDLPRGNGDPSLTQFPQPVSPNHHSLAITFGLLDNFYDSGMVSGDGWGWSTSAQTTDYNEKTIAVNYGNGGNGVTYDAEGTTRLIGEGLPDVAPDLSQFTVRLTSLLDPTGSSSILPGTKDVNAPFGSANFTPNSRRDGDGMTTMSTLTPKQWAVICGIPHCVPTKPFATTVSSSIRLTTSRAKPIQPSLILS